MPFFFRLKIKDLRIKNQLINLIVAVFFLFLFLNPKSYFLNLAHGQAFDYSNYYDIADDQAKAGDIIVFNGEQGLIRSPGAYDIHMFGVLQDQALVELKRTDGTGKPVMRAGIGKVNISLSNGQIKKGDYITTSTLPGIGMKATLSGNVIGIALEDSKENAKYTPDCVVNPANCVKDQISITVKPDYADLTDPRSTNRLFEYIGTSFFRNSQDPQGFGRIIKNIVAGMIILICLLFGLVIISRTIPKTMEAIGRNPMAKKSIQFSLAVNIAVVGFVVIAGIAAALIVLRL